jgi:hypothetical protein
MTLFRGKILIRIHIYGVRFRIRESVLSVYYKEWEKNRVMFKFRCCLSGGSFVEETQGWRAVPQGDPVHPH